MAFTDGSTVAFTVGGTTYRYNLSSSQGSAGIWTVQNVTPTFTQAKAGDALDNEVQPFAEESFSDWTGSIGEYQSSDDPGDLTRPFFTSLDTSKARQLTGVGLTRGTSGTFDNILHVPDPAGTVFAWVQSANGPGIIAKENGSASYSYWRWTGAGFTWNWFYVVNGTPNTGNPTGALNRAVTGSMHPPFQTVVQFGSSLWMANATGLTDINNFFGPPAVAGAIANIAATCRFFDQLVTLSIRNNNIEVVCLNDSAGDATLTRTQSIAEDGSSFNNIAKIYGEAVVMGAVALNGTLFVFTDKSLYALQWIEATKVFVVMPIIQDTAKFTSNPAIFAGELYCGSDNQLWHWTPGQGNNDFKQPDPTGWLPKPYNGRIVELHPLTQTLVAKVVNTTGATGTDDSVLLRYTALGAWQFGANCSNTTPSGVVAPAVKTQDGTNFSAIHYFNTNTTSQGIAVFEGGQNIRTLTAGAAQALPGIHVTPWRYGANRTAQKQYLRDRLEFDGSVAADTWDIYWQSDLQHKAADSPSFAAFVGGTGLGTWQKASPSIQASVTADAGSALDSTGSGVLWCEHDGSNGSDWHGATAYPSYKRIRFLYALRGSGSLGAIPALLSHSYQRLEYAFKFYVINTTLHLEVHQDHPNNPGTLTDATSLMAEVNRIQGWDYGKNIITVVGPDNVSYPSVITKYLANVTKIDPNGVWSVDIALTLQCVKMFGLAI